MKSMPFIPARTTLGLSAVSARRLRSRRGFATCSGWKAGYGPGWPRATPWWSTRSTPRRLTRPSHFKRALAQSLGFEVPETLLTTRAEAARDFLCRHGEVIYKALGGTRTVTRLLDPTDDARLARIDTCPVHLQRFVRGTNVRVHVVGGQSWACEVAGQHTDWRYPAEGDEVVMASSALPPEVLDRCVSVTAALGLYLSGIDLVRDHSGRYFFLEANTSPGFTCFPASDEIALAVAQLLISGRSALSCRPPAGIAGNPDVQSPGGDVSGPAPRARQYAGMRA